jgi:putative FmdB family regulatory protein
MDYYCPACDRTFSESETVSTPPLRKCPVCGFTLSSRQARRSQRARLAELERQVAVMRPLVHALATMPPVVVNVSAMPCPWCLGRGQHAEECPVTLARHVETAQRL